MPEKEIWRAFSDRRVPVGYYEVSNFGRVRRVRPGKGARVGHVLRPGRVGAKADTHLLVALSVEGTVYEYYVHQLVARVFLGPPPPGKEVNHKDLIKTNNHYRNLEYMTRQENCIHALAHGSRPPETRAAAGRKISKTKRQMIRAGLLVTRWDSSSGQHRLYRV